MELPDPLPASNIRSRGDKEKQGMAGGEAAEATERDTAQEQSQIDSAVAAHCENQIILDTRKKASERNRRNRIALASQAQDEIDA